MSNWIGIAVGVLSLLLMGLSCAGFLYFGTKALQDDLRKKRGY